MSGPRFAHAARHLVVALGALAATCLVGSCRSTPPTPSTPSTTVSADTWALVDGRAITRETVERAYRRTRDASATPSDEEALALKLSLLEELIIQEILLGKARELKIELPETELDTAYADAKKNIPDESFQQELTRRNVTAADMREELRRELLSRKVIEREVGSKITVTDQEVTDFFNANRAQFNIAEEAYHIAQIVVTPVRDPQITNRRRDDATTPQAAAAKMKMLLERLRAGTSFREIAADYSEDPDSAQTGGDLGFMPVSRLKQAPPLMRDAVLNKEPGTINVVSTGGAHTIVMVVAREPAGQRDLTMPAVRDRITASLRGRKEQLLRAAYLTAAQNNANVVNYLARRIVETQGKMPEPAAIAPTQK